MTVQVFLGYNRQHQVTVEMDVTNCPAEPSVGYMEDYVQVDNLKCLQFNTFRRPTEPSSNWDYLDEFVEAQVYRRLDTMKEYGAYRD